MYEEDIEEDTEERVYIENDIDKMKEKKVYVEDDTKKSDSSKPLKVYVRRNKKDIGTH
ncbi:hypothetical protein TanjilG_29374 [Lupinus angustifolius]|uniref:Uncharacterized protein n=1 Tax=Lupinus angustifolius TaxID=3871 RepID=A0A1J7GEZ6_LUPAN|nr:hypothetical protein TanjilG_29374 [Lupinus angustifolius]